MTLVSIIHGYESIGLLWGLFKDVYVTLLATLKILTNRIVNPYELTSNILGNVTSLEDVNRIMNGPQTISVLPVSMSHEEVVRKKLKPGKFVFTASGVTKVIGIIFLLAAFTFFLASSECENEASWRKYLFLVVNAVTIVISVTFYIIFTLGLTVKRPGFWVITDIILNIIFPVNTIICSVVATSTCISRSHLHQLPQPLAITGGVLLIASAACLALLYPHKQDVIPEMPEMPVEEPPNKRRQSRV